MSFLYDTSQIFSRIPEIVYVTPQTTRHRRIQRSIHRHTLITELGFVYQGEGTYLCDGYSYPIRPGDFLLYNQGGMHAVESASEMEIGTYFFGIANMQLTGHDLGWMTEPEKGFVRPAQQNIAHTSQTCQMVYDLISSDQLSRRVAAHHMFIGLLLSALDCPSDSRSLLQNRDTVLAMRIQQYISLHFAEPLTLKSIAEDLNISPYYAAHVFKDQLGISPINFMIDCRIGEAQNLLISTDFSVTQIGAMVGYESSSHFNAIFRQKVGMPPLRYRKHYLDQMRGKRKQ